MYRLIGIGVIVFCALPAAVRADAFDNYFNTLLKKIPDSKSAEKITKLTAEMMAVNGRALPGLTAAFVVVKTNGGRFAKLLVRPAAHKVSDQEIVPVVFIERYTTFKDGEERAVLETGQRINLYGDYRFNLDVGQVVPKNVPADLHVGIDKDQVYLEPAGKAEMYLVTKHLPEADPVKPAKLVVGAKFEIRYFNGAYQLYDDGRRSGKLNLKVADNGDVTGHYFSDKDGGKYDVEGKVSNSPQHMISFDIIYPRTLQHFTGYLFTGDGRAITGFSSLQNRETGFYAERLK